MGPPSDDVDFVRILDSEAGLPRPFSLLDRWLARWKPPEIGPSAASSPPLAVGVAALVAQFESSRPEVVTLPA